jgi:hypothetical protein
VVIIALAFWKTTAGPHVAPSHTMTTELVIEKVVGILIRGITFIKL